MEDKKILQDVEFEMLCCVKRICEKHGIKYYIIDGTLLGAVRHKGFIPWDDDIDIAFPRSEYYKFVEVVDTELPNSIKFKSYESDHNYHHFVPRLVNDSVKIINRSYTEPRIEPAWVDLFILDGAPISLFLLKLHKYRILWRRVLIGWANYQDVQDAKKGRPIYEKVLMFIGVKLKPGKLLNLQKQYRKLDIILKKYSEVTSPMWLTINGERIEKITMDKTIVYGNGTNYEFEGELFNGPQNYDEYLKRIYGDYMVLPPINERNKHDTEIFNV